MKTGIIGLGKMGGALLRGMLKAGAVSPEEVWVYDHHHENVQALQQEYPACMKRPRRRMRRTLWRP
ncbi:NAD(P)-binding domain-containing protein [Akkermansia sp. EB-AMDK43]|uniref:pyrroline-5-carboxylate reductase family protein n=1 Tax=Akkermansia sp. EB-AMDK43 TaxID=3073964 RepID=UPI0028687C8C|nr:NAD(P)-binding domain-containing protein [Akkermansia sp. EB-AMDK43]WMX37662.1 NAD(P)-binding domain-containing protein [Akkermansia sp. EB-AMDK43]